MKKTIVHPKIQNAFIKAHSSLDDVIPKFFVDIERIDDMPISVMEGPYRDLGYIKIPRLTVTADPVEYFSLGCFLINCSQKLRIGERYFNQFSLKRLKNTKITKLGLSIWKSDDDKNLENSSENSIFELNRDISSLSPLSSFKLNEEDYPIVGIIRRTGISFLPNEGVQCDGSVMCLGISALGAYALGQTLVSFSIASDLAFIQFEQSHYCGGVARASYELECLMSGSFASDALFVG